MRKNRADGFYIENINPYQKLMPHIIPKRYDSQIMSTVDVRCENIDKFIKEQSLLGKNYTYNEIIVASVVRLLAKRPSLNRFVVNRRIYQHNDITVNFTIKKRLSDDSEETTVKLHFDGHENLDEVKAAMDDAISQNTSETAYNETDKTAEALTTAPHWVIKALVGILKFLDKRNRMPKDIVEASPFHNSIFITFMKSIKGDWVMHHCYDFGTTGLFLSVGKDRAVPVVEGGEIKVGRVMQMGVVIDERFCDGLYFVNSFRMWQNILRDPKTLFENYDLSSEEHINHGVRSKETKQKYKQIARQQRLEKKQAKKRK